MQFFPQIATFGSKILKKNFFHNKKHFNLYPTFSINLQVLVYPDLLKIQKFFQRNTRSNGARDKIFCDSCGSKKSSLDPYVLLNEAEEVAEIFNKKIRHLNHQDTILFLEHFWKKAELSSKDDKKNKSAVQYSNDGSLVCHIKEDNKKLVIQKQDQSNQYDDRKTHNYLNDCATEEKKKAHYLFFPSILIIMKIKHGENCR
jgi:hypothetical protein